MFLTNHITVENKSRHLVLLLAAIFAAIMVSCGGTANAEDDLVLAEDAIREGRYSDAAGICRDILLSEDSAGITVRQMCRIAVVYAAAADNDCDNEENMARAADCFKRAEAVSADSVAAFINSLSVEEQSVANMAHRLAQGTRSDLRNYEDCLPDSIDVHGHE